VSDKIQSTKSRLERSVASWTSCSVRVASSLRKPTITCNRLENKLRELIKKMGIKPRDLLPIYRELGLAKQDFSDDEIISLMVNYPDLIQRPIVEPGERAVMGRPVENVRNLLEEKS